MDGNHLISNIFWLSLNLSWYQFPQYKTANRVKGSQRTLGLLLVLRMRNVRAGRGWGGCGGITGEVAESGQYEGQRMGGVVWSLPALSPTLGSAPYQQLLHKAVLNFPISPRRNHQQEMGNVFFPSSLHPWVPIAWFKLREWGKQEAGTRSWLWGESLKKPLGEETCLQRGTSRSRALGYTNLQPCGHPGPCTTVSTASPPYRRVPYPQGSTNDTV